MANTYTHRHTGTLIQNRKRKTNADTCTTNEAKRVFLVSFFSLHFFSFLLCCLFFRIAFDYLLQSESNSINFSLVSRTINSNFNRNYQLLLAMIAQSPKMKFVIISKIGGSNPATDCKSKITSSDANFWLFH